MSSFISLNSSFSATILFVPTFLFFAARAALMSFIKFLTESGSSLSSCATAAFWRAGAVRICVFGNAVAATFSS